MNTKTTMVQRRRSLLCAFLRRSWALPLTVLIIFFCCNLPQYSSAYSINHHHHHQQQQQRQRHRSLGADRRSFLSTAVVGVGFGAVSFPRAATAVDVKVTPLAKTFVTAGGKVKPIRENDATRLLTNARVVLLFEGGDGEGVASTVPSLTMRRKAERGPGVTPGRVSWLSTTSDASDDAVAAVVRRLTPAETSAIVDATVRSASSLPEGDVLLVGPLRSKGTAADGDTTAAVAERLGLSVGGKGVLSVLSNGPREGLALEDNGRPVSDVLWYEQI